MSKVEVERKLFERLDTNARDSIAEAAALYLGVMEAGDVMTATLLTGSDIIELRFVRTADGLVVSQDAP